MRSLLIFILSFVFHSLFGQWVAHPVTPTIVAQPGLVSHPNGNIYLFNGYNGTGPEYNSLYIYNPATNTWTTGANVPFARRGMGYCLGDDSKIYSLGGAPNGSAFACYTPSTNTWTNLALCPTGTWEGSMVSYNNKIYYTGGTSFSNLLRIYDIASNTWSTGANLPTTVMQHKLVSDQTGNLYIFGGRQSVAVPSNAIQRYNVATDTWSVIGTIPVQKNQFGACLGPDGQIYLVCGKNAYLNNGLPVFSSVHIYNPCTNTWTAGPSHPFAHGELAVTSTSNGIFAMGGSNGSAVNYNYFLPVAPQWQSFPVVTVSPVSNMLCNNIQTTISVTGANTYTWDNSSNTESFVITPTANISYTVSGTNTVGCTTTLVKNFSISPIPTLTITGNSTVCSGKSATLTASGASTYVWVNGPSTSTAVFTPSVQTVYSVSGTSTAGCNNTNTFTVDVNPSPTVSITFSQPTICLGQSATLTANGADTYTWTTPSNNTLIVVSPSVSTTYSVSGTNSVGCVSSGTFIAAVYPLPNVNIAGTSSICIGQSSTLTANGAYSFTWNTNSTNTIITVSPTVTTLYSVSATSSLSCVNNQTFLVVVNPIPNLNVTSNPSIACIGQLVVLTANGGDAYTWNSTLTGSVIVISPTATTIFTVVSTYTQTGCSTSTIITQLVNSCTGIFNIHSAQNELLVYPNPNNGSFIIRSNELGRLYIFNSLGQQIMDVELTANNNFGIYINNFSEGIYFIRSKEGQLKMKVIVAK